MQGSPPIWRKSHKIKVGNSLVGCWLDRVEDYPLKAWEREGGDGKKGERTRRIKSFLNPVKVDGEWCMVRGKTIPVTTHQPPPTIKDEMRQVIESKFSNQAPLFPDMKVTTESVVTEARAEYEKLHDLPVGDPDERERYYRDHIQNSPTLRTLKSAMDEWCAIWFWPTDEESLKHVPTPLTFHAGQVDGDQWMVDGINTPPTTHHPPVTRQAIVERLASEVKFFHWELEFPDVFSSERCGFDGVLGNPPWEVMKPISQEFFTEFDPLYRTYDKQTALRHQKQMFEDIHGVLERWDEYNASFKGWSNWVKNAAGPFDLSLERGNRQKELASAWEKARSSRTGFAAEQKPFSFQGSADLNSYKLFLEVAHHLLAAGGRMGLIVPSGLYTDAGCHDLRDLFLSRSTWDWLFGFINWEQIFSIYYRFKFVVMIAQRQTSPKGHAIRSCFGRYKLRDWEQAESVVFPLPKRNVLEFSPKTLSILEITNQRDLDICRKIYDHSFRVGDEVPGWELKYAAEFHMTNDSKLFKPREHWESSGYRSDPFGRWIGPDGDIALPLYEGRMVGQYDFAQKEYVSGRGRSAVWHDLHCDNKRLRPQFLMKESTLESSEKATDGWKLVGMSIASSTNNRTVIATCQTGLPCNHALFTLRFNTSDAVRCLLLEAAFNSLTFDFTTRQRVGGLNLSWFILEECPLPKQLTGHNNPTPSRLLLNALRLSLIHRRFAPAWLKMRHLAQSLGLREWKHWWAVMEADRLRLRIENDAIVADLYGLESEEFSWIIRNDPSDPKGFWRIDKHLKNEQERYPELAAAAFRALKEGKWSAETAPDLSNDEFFDILDIPEMTSAEAAKAKGESGPLIQKRDGCHVWKPENFPTDDPRHGWTWDDCWNDAVALLGSEQAVREYVEGKPETSEEQPEHTGPKDLFGNPIPTDLFGNEIPKTTKRRTRR